MIFSDVAVPIGIFTGVWVVLNGVYVLSVDLTLWTHLPNDPLPESTGTSRPVSCRICVEEIRGSETIRATERGLILRKSGSIAFALCSKMLGERRVDKDRCQLDLSGSRTFTISIDLDPQVELVVLRSSASEDLLDTISKWETS